MTGCQGSLHGTTAESFAFSPPFPSDSKQLLNFPRPARSEIMQTHRSRFCLESWIVVYGRNFQISYPKALETSAKFLYFELLIFSAQVPTRRRPTFQLVI